MSKRKRMKWREKQVKLRTADRPRNVAADPRSITHPRAMRINLSMKSLKR